MADSISIGIGLEGGDDVRKTLEEIVGGVDGLKDSAEALGKLDATVNVKAEGADEAKTKIDEVKGAAEELGQTDATVKVGAEGAAEAKGLLDPVSQSATVVSAALDAMTLGMNRSGKAAAQAGAGLAQAAGAGAQLGATTAKSAAGLEILGAAFGRLKRTGEGVFDSLGVASERAGRRLTRSLGPLAGAARALGPIGIVAGGVALGTTALSKFAIAATETEKALSQLQIVSGQSFEALSLMANVFAQGGTGLKQFASEFGNLAEKIAAAGQQMLMRKAGKEAVDWANDIDRVRQQFENLANGVKVTFSPLTTMDTKVKAVLESLAKIKDPAKQQEKLAEIFKNLGSDLERAALGKALGLSPETIATLSLGAAKLQEMADEADRLGLTLDELDKANLKDLSKTRTEATSLFSQLKDKMGALAAPALTSFWQGFSDRIKELIPDFLDMAAAFGQMDFSGVGAAAADFIALLGKIAVGLAALATGEVTFTQVGAEAFRVLTALVWEFAAALLTIAWDMIKAGATAAWDWVIQKIGEAKIAVLDFAASLPGTIWDGIKAGATAAWDWVIQKIGEAKTAVLDFAASLPGTIWDAAIAGIQTLIDKVKELFGLRPTPGGGGAPAPAHAGGGLLGGRGTGTSDSNLAWLSRGEYITPAHAVRQPGVLAFLEALRRSGGDLSRVLDGMGRFALGGMVPRAIPAFAAGGLTGGNNVTIQFPGLPAIGGLRASSSVVDQLQKAAALAQVRSGGRKPSRYS